MYPAKPALFAAFLLLPASALAAGPRLTCTVDQLDIDGNVRVTQKMSIAYDGDETSGPLTVTSDWGEMLFPYAEYTAGEAAGDYKIVGNWPATIIMPDLPALEDCLTDHAPALELQFLDVLSPLVEDCRVMVPDGKEPVGINAEVTIEVVAGKPDVYIVRRYDAESPVSGGHIDIVSLPQPQCTVVPE